MSKKNRKHERVTADFKAQLKFLNVHDSEHLAVVADISAGGLRLEAPSFRQKVGDKIAFLLGFRFGDPNHPILGIGEVRWKDEPTGDKPAAVGVMFTSVDFVSMERIATFIRKKQE